MRNDAQNANPTPAKKQVWEQTRKHAQRTHTQKGHLQTGELVALQKSLQTGDQHAKDTDWNARQENACTENHVCNPKCCKHRFWRRGDSTNQVSFELVMDNLPLARPVMTCMHKGINQWSNPTSPIRIITIICGQIPMSGLVAARICESDPEPARL